ncbi:hypothetical protein [Leucobacter sp. HY1910]
MYSSSIYGEITKPIAFATNDRGETLALVSIAMTNYRMVNGTPEATAYDVNVLQVIPQGRTDIMQRVASLTTGVTVNAMALLDDCRTVNGVDYYAVSDQGFLVVPGGAGATAGSRKHS